MAKSKTTTYCTCAANGRQYAEKIADSYRSQGYHVTVTEGSIPQWGSGIPSSSTYGKSESGYRIEVTKK